MGPKMGFISLFLACSFSLFLNLPRLVQRLLHASVMSLYHHTGKQEEAVLYIPLLTIPHSER